MANRTDTQADTVHGTNPQYLVDRIVRVKIYNDAYWKEHCFALTAETVIDKAIELDYIGGTYGGRRRPAKFLCLMLKLLQIQPDEDVIMEYIKQPDSKYLRALGAAYLRLTSRAKTIHDTLEPLYADYRKLRYREITGKLKIIHMDEWIDWCFHEDTIIDITMPQLPKREVLEYSELLEPYTSVLEDDLEDLDELEGAAEGEEEEAPDDLGEQQVPCDASAAPASPASGGSSHSPRRQKEAAPRRASRERSRSPRRHKERRARSPSRGRASVSRSPSRPAREEKRKEEKEKAKTDKKEKGEKKEKKDSKDKREKKDKKEKKEERNESEERQEKAIVEEKPKKEKKEKREKPKGLWKEDRGSGGKAGKAESGGKKAKDGELSTEGWNDVRRQLGLKPLKD